MRSRTIVPNARHRPEVVRLERHCQVSLPWAKSRLQSRHGDDGGPRHAKHSLERPLEEIDRDRRRYLARLAATIAGASLGVFAISRVIDGAVARVFRPRPRDGVAQFVPLTAASLAGKVVLVDFWTYTLHQLVAHASICPRVGTEIPGPPRRDRRAHAGLPLNRTSITSRRAVREMGIEYPVAVDNEYAVWRALPQSMLASSVLRRCAGTRSRSPLRRGEIRAVRAERCKNCSRRSGWRRTWD